jgi:ABC-type antimicrobial peptide transport system permease subunit
MFNKLTVENKKKFLRCALVYLPVGFVLGILIAFFIAKFVKVKISMEGTIFALAIAAVVGIESLWKYYRTLAKQK